jgi:putative glutamine amidotransferase
MGPFVALTTTLDPQGGAFRKPRVGIYANYLHVLQRVGVVPVLTSPAHHEDGVAELVRASKGLVLSGGEDVNPSRYGESPIPELGEVNPARDAMEWRALDVAVEMDMPVLGICRGMQVLNVYFGGSLYQDLVAQRGTDVVHLQEAPWGQHHHVVACHAGTRLEQILGDCAEMEINSFHHQAVKDLAPGLRSTAESEDGLIEAVESLDHAWIVGVQWHPERHEAEAADIDPNLRILQAFADAVREYAAG